jgi:hypothetical protein
LGRLAKAEKMGVENYEGDIHMAVDWAPMWEQAKKLARQIGWEGDIRTGPYVTVIPNIPGNYCPCDVLIAWNQDNNGATFIASPHPRIEKSISRSDWVLEL